MKVSKYIFFHKKKEKEDLKNNKGTGEMIPSGEDHHLAPLRSYLRVLRQILKLLIFGQTHHPRQ